MTPIPSPRTEMPARTAAGPGPAEPARTPAGRGAPKGAARQGVLSACRPDPQQSTPGSPAHSPFVGLLISAPPSWGDTPSATARCGCGDFERTVTGRAAVVRLVADWTEHRETTCPRVPSETAALAARRREEAERWAHGRKKHNDRTR
ncbi:hypothetical protein [Streptomyces rimosus]|uniref:hypothetical protein n=1 Tax=Streptomyces rimosus TaxID=1927 RepID=UPI0037CEB1A1